MKRVERRALSSFVMDSGVTGFADHPSDYYEITAQLAVAL